ncbi:putative quinol monooxygenase [Saccharopolyspora flava]|uniref:Quinol monooxygenase YgiN n=1 Tax=Saccharopolyspora flava TaxID=95161 RepID=A0A1I6V3J1_9PSEU|nr:antibiotic biosynthesis monooxygenase [Saccharopolyspora flava]SFT08279.1 Quinol monooxygenase YgiN [Saccharopolyspora flava]
MSFAVIARYTCASQDVEEVRAGLLDAREQSLKEPANEAYVVHQDVDDECVFVLYERYTDRAGFDAHTASDHYAEHIAGRVRPKLLDRTVTFAHVL